MYSFIGKNIYYIDNNSNLENAFLNLEVWMRIYVTIPASSFSALKNEVGNKISAAED